MGTENKKQKKLRLSGEERRTQIIDTALTLFAQKGFAGTRTREIAEAAGVSEALIFQHFKTKEELVRAALAVLYHPHPVSGELKVFLNTVDDDAGFFRTIALHLIEHNREDPRIMKLALFNALEDGHFGELTRSDETGPTMLIVITDYIRKRIDQGRFVAINPEIAARLFVQTVFMHMADTQACITGPRLSYSDEQIVEILVHIFLEGIKVK
jgi:AcrR family transcriptional regulator